MEPERELIRRTLPFALPAVVVAFVAGSLLRDAQAGWSAAIGVAVVFANFTAHGLSLAWAGAISPTMVYAVALGGFVVRLGVVVATIVLLRQFAWFSMGAFLAGLVPTTIALLAAEMKILSGRMQVDLWTFPEGRRQGTR